MSLRRLRDAVFPRARSRRAPPEPTQQPPHAYDFDGAVPLPRQGPVFPFSDQRILTRRRSLGAVADAILPGPPPASAPHPGQQHFSARDMHPVYSPYPVRPRAVSAGHAAAQAVPRYHPGLGVHDPEDAGSTSDFISQWGPDLFQGLAQALIGTVPSSAAAAPTSSSGPHDEPLADVAQEPPRHPGGLSDLSRASPQVRRPIVRRRPRLLSDPEVPQHHLAPDAQRLQQPQQQQPQQQVRFAPHTTPREGTGEQVTFIPPAPHSGHRRSGHESRGSDDRPTTSRPRRRRTIAASSLNKDLPPLPPEATHGSHPHSGDPTRPTMETIFPPRNQGHHVPAQASAHGPSTRPTTKVRHARGDQPEQPGALTAYPSPFSMSLSPLCKNTLWFEDHVSQQGPRSTAQSPQRGSTAAGGGRMPSEDEGQTDEAFIDVEGGFLSFSTIEGGLPPLPAASPGSCSRDAAGAAESAVSPTTYQFRQSDLLYRPGHDTVPLTSTPLQQQPRELEREARRIDPRTVEAETMATVRPATHAFAGGNSERQVQESQGLPAPQSRVPSAPSHGAGQRQGVQRFPRLGPPPEDASTSARPSGSAGTGSRRPAREPSTKAGNGRLAEALGLSPETDQAAEQPAYIDIEDVRASVQLCLDAIGAMTAFFMSLDVLGNRAQIQSVCVKLRDSVQNVFTPLHDTLNAEQYRYQGASASWRRRHDRRLESLQRNSKAMIEFAESLQLRPPRVTKVAEVLQKLEDYTRRFTDLARRFDTNSA